MRSNQPIMKRYKWLRRGLWTLGILFIALNVITALHAYNFTHFSNTNEVKTKMSDLGFWSKLGVMLSGVANPRPATKKFPAVEFETIILESNVKTECWKINANSSRGTVVICHGYSGSKSSMLNKADEFLSMNYSVLLVDFMGSGGSEGNQTTIGYYEAEQVKSCCEYLEMNGEKNIVLFGTSMGSVAIMKALAESVLPVSSAIVECPFGSLYETVCARFDMVNIPSFPMAGLLTFWGGVENGFWAFGHEPITYATQIECPVLLMYGEKDEKVSRIEIDEIYSNIRTSKQLVTFSEAGHEDYLKLYRAEWKSNVSAFLRTHSN